MHKTSIMLSPSFDPYHNLALEELLLSQLRNDEAILYLWQNQHTVVVGRHQNAWKECRVDRIEAAGGKLARRLSGGGAVYHDLGNLNFTFLVPKSHYNLERQLKVILGAVRGLGIDAEFSGRNDLLATGRKFSGNAFYHGKTASFHHGTILVDVDLTMLQNYLNVAAQKIISKGVESVKARVINLRELAPDLSIAQVQQAMRKSFLAEYGGTSAIIDENSLTTTPEFDALKGKYQSWEWRLGKSPSFDATYETRFPWGGIELGLMVHGGKVVEARVFSDAMEASVIEAMAKRLSGVDFDRTFLAGALHRMAELAPNPIITDVADWLAGG